ncbi:hypothetical protein BpHYR1_030394, partial [Brachionus plicatilis]
MLKERYRRKDHELYMRDKLRGLRQSKDIANYINDFRIILNQISEISEYDLITYFTQGLSELTENYVGTNNIRDTKNFTSNELLRHFTYIKGEKIETVFDTGTTISLISLSVAKKLNLHINPSHQKINTADGNTHEVLGETDLIKIEIEETVAHLNFFEQTKAIIDPSRRQLFIPGNRICLNPKSEESDDDYSYNSIYSIEDDDLTNEIVELNYNDNPPLSDNKKLNFLFVQNKNSFSLSLNDLGLCKSVTFEIETTSENLIMTQPFRQPVGLIDEMRKEIKLMLDA